MSDRPQNIKHRLISEEAADWLVCLRATGLSSGDRQEYVRWLKRSPAHVREMLELASLEELLRSADLTGIPPPPRDSFGTPERISSVVELIPRHRDEAPPDRRLSSWQQCKLAASVCLSRIEFAGRALSRFVGIRG
jgi:ferric-dicitrate binding protein FerR (iron transport regulator)